MIKKKYALVVDVRGRKVNVRAKKFKRYREERK